MPDDATHTISTFSSSFGVLSGVVVVVLFVVEVSGFVVEVSGLVVDASGFVVEVSVFVVEVSVFVVKVSGLVVDASGFTVELAGFVGSLFSSTLGVVCVVSSEGRVGSEGGEVIMPTQNKATDNIIATIVLILFFCKKVSIKGRGNIKKAAQSKNKLEKWKPFTNTNIAKNPPTIHLTPADFFF